MTSFEIDCPPTFLDCDKIDVFAEHHTDHSEFHLMKDGRLLTIIQRQLQGIWQYKSGKQLTGDELSFVRLQIENK